MEILLNSTRRKGLVFGAGAAVCLIYVLLAGRLFVASLYGEISAGEVPKLASLQRAAHLDPSNADYRDVLGDYYAQAGDLEKAIAHYTAATNLNPHSARYWLDLANAYLVLGDRYISNQTLALEHAIEADPTRPDVAWEAANFYLVQGSDEKALHEFRVVMANDPFKAGDAIRLCWHIKPDVDELLRDAVPARPEADIAFLSLLMTPRKIDLSTTTAPSNPSGKRWVYTLAAADARAESNAWANASISLSGYTGGATGNNVAAMITASTPTTIEITNPAGTATNTGAPVLMISRAVSDSDMPAPAGTNRETEATAKVWAALMASRQPFERRSVYGYIQYLIDHKDMEQARLVWQQAAPRFGLSAYLPTARNLIVNGDFSLDVLNGGFDWQYEKLPSVALTLDPSDFHSGTRSLLIAFDGPRVSDAGIHQFIAVQPSTTYDFSAYYKSGDFEGAGGPHITIQDVVSRAVLYDSDELKERGYWKLVSKEFTTANDCGLLELRIRRVPEGSPIRGKLWLDDFRLVAKGQ
jgi:carbohydrate binding protein with CBM4/9 domain/tetratricopeptide repeat protein